MATIRSAVERVRRAVAFAAAGTTPSQWPALAGLGWARGNPSSGLSQRWPAITVRPAALGGIPVRVSTRDLGQLISFEEIYVESAYNLDPIPFTPTLILDCGAHVGFFSLLAGARFPDARIEAFEPNPSNLDCLRANLAPWSPRVTIHAAAVSTRDGSARFTADVSNGGRIDSSGGAGIQVRVTDVRPLLPSTGSLLIKIDIEGEEEALVPHILAALPPRCAMFLETHHGDVARDALAGELRRHGFHVSVLRHRERFSDLYSIRNVA